MSHLSRPPSTRMPENNQPKPPNPLKAYRDEHGLSQAEIADKLEISRQMVGFLESGARKCTSEMALLIERRLGIDRALMLPEFFEREAA